MNYNKNEWRVSLERLNPELGYIKDNIVLTSIEFNSTRLQWSIEKVINMLDLLKEEFIFIEQNFKLIRKLRKKPEKIIKTIINDIEHYNCSYCNQIKNVNEFNAKISNGCIDCQNINAKKYIETPKGKLHILLNSAKSTTKRREKTNVEKRDNTLDIDFEFLVELYNNQKGLCAYSGIPLQFKSGQDWKMSLERINVLKGYIKDNVCLICNEFNTSDKSVIYTDNTLGNSGWTKEKFALFLERATEKYCK
jgi:hypothetical protein